MKIRMKNLVITNYCETDKRKLRFIKEISEDPLVDISYLIIWTNG